MIKLFLKVEKLVLWQEFFSCISE